MLTEELKATAKKYWSQGLNIVVLNGKKPLHDWTRWQTEKQNEKDFQNLPWEEADGFALICGQQTANGLYLGAIDFDVKNLPAEVFEKGRQALKNLPITHIEETPSGGQHWIYLSQTKPRTISAYHNVVALELIGEGKLCIMAPSTGYKRLNDNSPTIVKNLEALFYQALSSVSIKITETPYKQFWFNREDFANKQYHGKNPPCISSLFKGTCEGQRNEYAIRLASFLINFKGLDPNYAYKRLREWNRFNSPPLSEKELENVVKSAVKGCYVYGCEDEVLKQNCNAKECPMATKAKPLTAEEAEKAQKLLQDPKLLDYIVDYGRKRLVGEDNALILNFVTLCSGQTKYSISTILSGFSGSGKNESLRAVKPLIPEEWIFEFTTSTPEAIKYIGENFSGTLIIYEAEGVKGETGSLSLRAIGEGESIETIYPVRNELTGKMELGRAKTRARNFITTQSDLDIHPDLYRRVFKYEMNHSIILTKRVLAKKLRDAIMPESLKQLIGRKENPTPYCEADFQNALRLNDWKAEVITFPPSGLLRLLDLAVTKEQKVALRTHVEKILNFVRVLALINQTKRIRFKIGDNVYVIAAPEDFLKALEVLQTSIKETITRLGKRQNEVLELFESEDSLDKHKVAEKLGVSSETAKKALKSLANAGYLKENTATKPYTYTLLRKEPNYRIMIENPGEYCLFWRESLEKFLNKIGQAAQQKGIPLQTLKPDRIEVKLFYNHLTAKDTEKNINLKVEPEKAAIYNNKVLPTPSEENTSFFAENDQKYMGFFNITRDNSIFLWRQIPPAEKCELCGVFAVEYELKVASNGTVFRRCKSCFDQMRHRFSNSRWKRMENKGEGV